MTDVKYPTKYTESNALLAIVRDDYADAREILEDSSKFELEALGESAQALADFCNELAQERK